MLSALDRATLLAEQLTDTMTAAASAAWPRSAAAQEIARLAGDGYDAGSLCEVEFSVELPEAGSAKDALRDLRAADFRIAEQVRGFVIVRSSLSLRAWDLARATSKLRRVAGRHGGFAMVVGPVDSAPMAMDDASLPASELAARRMAVRTRLTGAQQVISAA